MADITAVYDACVLYPAPVRDLLMHLALTDLFRARWTDAIHAEWIRSVLKQRPDLSRTQLERTRDLINAHVRDGLITGYEHLIPTLSLPDPQDRHVLAAAIHTGADIIVTYNLSDFPPAALQPHSVHAQHPDAFVCALLDTDMDTVCGAVRRQRENLVKRPKTAEELLMTLERVRLIETARRLRAHIDHI